MAWIDVSRCIYVRRILSVRWHSDLRYLLYRSLRSYKLRCAEYWKFVDINEIQKPGLTSKSSICSIPYSFWYMSRLVSWPVQVT